MADDFAAPFAEDGEVIGFDGSQMTGRAVDAARQADVRGDGLAQRGVALHFLVKGDGLQ